MTARLLVHALRAARPTQLRGRALRPLRRRRFPVSSPPSFEPPHGAAELWRSSAFASVALAGDGDERLRTFHAHYGEDVLGRAREGDEAGAREVMERWVDRNVPRPGDAWHPYPVSTRTGNWIAALALAPNAVSNRIVESLWRQLLHLERNVEDDVLGNHVIRNARALVLGGVAFGTDRLLERGLRLLERELHEQILADGGHYERSPVYHLIVLRDLLEIDGVIPGAVPSDVLDRMRRFGAALHRPDGQPALFNDGTLELAPRLDLPAAQDGLSIFPETGYAVLRHRRLWLAFDCGPPSPEFLPAHAHADALSFQLWLDGAPVVIDPGMPTYDAGAERDWFRGTRAHSTVAVDGADQFVLWGAFRSGPLPDVTLLAATSEELEAAVTWPSGVRHVRRISFSGDEVFVRDRIEGSGEHTLESSLPLGNGRARLIEPTGCFALARESRTVAECLYERVEGTALVARGRRQLPTDLGWRFAFEDVATIDS